MYKLLFFDYRDFEVVEGFVRHLEPPDKFTGNPILVSDHPVEWNHMSMYGSVVHRPEDGQWQMWYAVSGPDGSGRALAYAESPDGVIWQRSSLDLVPFHGSPSHLVFDKHPHGSTVFFDQRETIADRRYKLLTGAAPSHRISAFQSADGIHWRPAAENPVIGINPDCPMSLHRARDGRYILYARPQFGDRRVARRESWDLVHWSEPKIVIDQEPGDHPQTQFYGLGAIPYGAYEIGTLWIYNTDADDVGFQKMHGHQQPEFAYTRTGYAWHRAALGVPWIALGSTGSWEWGNIQPASAPVLLDDEIRFYYVAARTEHGTHTYEGSDPRYGIGFASMKPDRFVGVTCAAAGQILTNALWTQTPEFYINAKVPAHGDLRLGVEDVEGKPIAGFEIENCLPIQGDALHHQVTWRNSPDHSQLINREVRLRVHASQATIYALCVGSAAELSTYWEFEIPGFLNQELSQNRPWLVRA